MKKFDATILASVVLVLSACASGPSPYVRMSETELDSERCENSWCQYEIALAFFRLGKVQKGWSYMELSARDGYPDAQKFYIKYNKQVPHKDVNANY